MDNKGLVLWTLGGAGVFLLYAAYKNQSPQDLLVKHLNGGSGSVAPISGSASPSNSPAPPAFPGTAPLAPGQTMPLPGQSTPDFIPVTPIAGKGYTKSGDRYYAVDNNGVMVAELPGVYQNAPQLHINTQA